MTNPKPTDTSRSGDLVEEMRDLANAFGDDVKRRYSQDLLREAADRLEALEDENERLREAVGILEDGLQEVGDDYPGSSCQEWCQHQIKQARAALSRL